ncbi:hypothetical protein KIN20_010698 [Parelaphostrongylus tenuis]|uniref:Lipoprotein n=1 Tax=Parelaphostrongylus tenuis TaxID=148309 RepID=A0AAD5QLZ5_PARTN|nr:hypothetical protein KIN20_010691 [Parelaphostrongylus tenuis]KAJ1353920.1 hypothetical protein KIN20_010698 [Parelaphostrongylus tenuis]
MGFPINKAGVRTDHIIILLLATIATVFGCGVMPAGQGSTRNFTVTGFTLPVAMVYSTAPAVSAQVPGIATTEAGAKGFVERLVKQTVSDVLEGQARNALLPDAVISAILSQLTVTVNYTPLECPIVRFGEADVNRINANEMSCIIIDNTVTAICSNMNAREMKSCTLLPQVVDADTTNFIMASWSKAMWQSVVNRAIRMLASGPFESHFRSAFAAVD